MGNRVMLSAAVIAQDCADDIAACVDSLSFADEIVVVDACSEDGTDRVAHAHGARVVRNAWPGFSAQWRRAVDECRGTWVLICASDERATVELASSVRAAIGMTEEEAIPAGGRTAFAGGPNEERDAVIGYTIARRNHFLGVPIHHGRWAHDRPLRLFRRAQVRVDDAPVHEGFHVDGKTGDLDGVLDHFTHPSLDASIRRANLYTTLEAQGRMAGRRVYLVEAFVAAPRTFFNYYLRGGLWRDGVPGILLAATSAIYRSLLYLKTFLFQRDVRDAQKTDAMGS